MGTEYITSTVNNLFEKLDIASKNLDGFSQEIDERRDEINKILLSIPAKSNEFSKVVKPKKESNLVDKAVESILTEINASIDSWNNDLTSQLKGTEFMKKHEKYLVVMVFGAVKAGKSSLGNFFAGKYFSNSNVETEYNHRDKPQFISEESGRETGGLTKELNGDTWFTEGVTDTTGAIQYFTLSGLRWMDSPGTGAVKKDGDSKDMEQMVNDYIPFVDLCIFLMNSSEPGLQEDMKYMEKLSREGQESLVVITRSDVVEEDIDENDEIIKTLRPKEPERRKLQEDDIVTRLAEQYPDLDSEKFRAMSVSTMLARHAIEEENESKFKDSNLDKLMNLLADKASTQTTNLKIARPKRNMNSFIERLITGDNIDHKFDGLETLLAKFKELQNPIDEYKQKLENRKQRVTNLIIQDIQSDLKSNLLEWNQIVESSKNTIDSNKMNTEINKIIEKGINKGINKEVASIIDGYSNDSIKSISSLVTVQSLGKSYEEVEHSYKERILVERDPDGVWENIRSLLGKTYYRTRTITHTEILKIDVGTNVNDVLESLLNQSRAIIDKEVKAALLDIQKQYFLPQEKYIATMTNMLQDSIQQLRRLKYEDA